MMRGVAYGLLAAAFVLILGLNSPATPHEAVEDGTFEIFCRSHTTAQSYAIAENREQFFELEVCSIFKDVTGFEPKATLYPLETIEDVTIYYAAFPNGMSVIAIK